MERVLRSWQAAALVLAALLVQGCSATTQFVAKSPGTTLEVGGSGRVVLPQSRKMSSKSTGQYEFMATTSNGQPMYGLLPLKVNGGTMAVSIIFFAPALATQVSVS